MRFLNIINRPHVRPPRLAAALALASLMGLVALPMAAVPATPSPPPAVSPVVAPAEPAPPAEAAPPEAPEVPAPRAEVEPRAVAAPPEAPAPPAPSAPPAPLTNPLPQGRVAAGWGPMVDPFTHETRSHGGVDLAAPSGTPVIAAADGVVSVATESYEPSKGSGTVVIVQHDNGLTTVYSHLGSLEVGVGQRVASGETLATVGTTGKTTGPHLHFEVHRNGVREDPAAYVADWR